MTRAAERDRERNATWIAVLTRLHDVDPGLASRLRSAAFGGRLSYREAMRVVELLQQLPAREESSNG